MGIGVPNNPSAQALPKAGILAIPAFALRRLRDWRGRANAAKCRREQALLATRIAAIDIADAHDLHDATSRAGNWQHALSDLVDASVYPAWLRERLERAQSREAVLACATALTEFWVKHRSAARRGQSVEQLAIDAACLHAGHRDTGTDAGLLFAKARLIFEARESGARSSRTVHFPLPLLGTGK